MSYQETEEERRGIEAVAHVHEQPPAAPVPIPAAEPIKDSETAEEVAQEGPEGRPTVPAMSSAGLLALVLTAVGLLILIAAAVAYWVSIAAGIVILGFALVTLVLNPAALAAILRAHDRDVVQKRHVHQTVIRSDQWPQA